MMFEIIGFQGQGIHLCNQSTENNDNFAHGAHFDHQPLLYAENWLKIISLSYPIGHQMVYETIGIQGQGIHLCNQITETNDNYAHGVPYDHQQGLMTKG